MVKQVAVFTGDFSAESVSRCRGYSIVRTLNILCYVIDMLWRYELMKSLTKGLSKFSVSVINPYTFV